MKTTKIILNDGVEIKIQREDGVIVLEMDDTLSMASMPIKGRLSHQAAAELGVMLTEKKNSRTTPTAALDYQI